MLWFSFFFLSQPRRWFVDVMTHLRRFEIQKTCCHSDESSLWRLCLLLIDMPMISMHFSTSRFSSWVLDYHALIFNGFTMMNPTQPVDEKCYVSVYHRCTSLRSRCFSLCTFREISTDQTVNGSWLANCSSSSHHCVNTTNYGLSSERFLLETRLALHIRNQWYIESFSFH